MANVDHVRDELNKQREHAMILESIDLSLELGEKLGTGDLADRIKNHRAKLAVTLEKTHKDLAQAVADAGPEASAPPADPQPKDVNQGTGRAAGFQGDGKVDPELEASKGKPGEAPKVEVANSPRGAPSTSELNVKDAIKGGPPPGGPAAAPPAGGPPNSPAPGGTPPASPHPNPGDAAKGQPNK